MYANIFKKVPELHGEVKDRIIPGNTIIDRESVSGFGKNKIDGVVIYHIENNKIKRVDIIR